jgi:hypothetical protein
LEGVLAVNPRPDVGRVIFSRVRQHLPECTGWRILLLESAEAIGQLDAGQPARDAFLDEYTYPKLTSRMGRRERSWDNDSEIDPTKPLGTSVLVEGGTTRERSEELSPLWHHLKEAGFAHKAIGLSFVAPEKLEQFFSFDADLARAGLRKLFPSKAEYFRSYVCRSCELYLIEFGTTFDRHQAQQVARSMTEGS